jgi:hypothetical protein
VWRRISDFSSAKSSAFGGDFAACFSIALSLDAGTYSFGSFTIHPHSLLISFEKLCGGERRNEIVVRLLRRCHFSSAKSSAFGGDFAACFSIALSIH